MNLDASSTAPHPSRAPSILRTALLGSSGLRAGWRLFLYALLVVGVSVAIQNPLGAIPTVRSAIQQAQGGVLTPLLVLLLEGPRAFAAILAAWIMSRIEKRSIQDYGLAIRKAFGNLFWQGALWGFAECTVLLLLIRAFHGFSLGTLALGGMELARYALLWAVGFLLVGLFEEYTFRGYGQFTLTSGMGFWPAAIVLSILFGAIHLGNSGEALFGAAIAGLFGLFGAFTVRRTGNLWFAVGEHAAFDYSETFIYSVPDSGQLATGHLMNSSFHDARWLTGGDCRARRQHHDRCRASAFVYSFQLAVPCQEIDGLPSRWCVGRRFKSSGILLMTSCV